MNLRTLVWLAALSYTFVIGGSLILYRLLVVYPTIEKTALELRQNNISALRAVYENDVENFRLFNMDWAKWDNTYQYAQGLLKNYPQDNFLNPSFLETETDAVIILNSQGHLLYATQKSGKRFKKVNSIQAISTDIDVSQILAHDNQTHLIRHKEHLGFYVSHFIQDSKKKHKHNGVLIFIRDFNRQYFKRLNLSNGASFIITPIKNNQTSPLKVVESFNINELKNNYTFGLGNSQGKVIAHAKFSYPNNSTPKLLDSTTLFSIVSLLTLPLFITIIIYFLLLRPIIEISLHINRMKKSGEVYHLTQSNYITEIDGFLKRFNLLVDKIHSYQQKLIDDSNTDGLTQIYNRKYFDEALDTAWRMSSRNNTNLSIIMMDIDYFKKYNDHYGHQQGDIALKKVAKALNDLTRRAEDTLARYGGEEFIIICRSPNQDQLKFKLQSILNSVQNLKIEHVNSKVSSVLTISCGACLITNTGPWMKDLKSYALKKADEALYEAKWAGRNHYCIQILEPEK